MKKKKRPAPFRAEPVEIPHEVQEALDVGKEILRVIDEDVEERAKLRAADYFESLEDRSKSICETIASRNAVTDNQRNALDNMLAGARKWVHDDDK